MFPELKTKHNWTHNDIGTLLKMNILDGKKIKRNTYIKIASVKKLINYINQNLEENKIKIN
jgi:hypothetical protein